MENITYFSSEATTDPSSVDEVCSTTICKIDEGICQLRLDFLTFSITGRARYSFLALGTL